MQGKSEREAEHWVLKEEEVDWEGWSAGAGRGAGVAEGWGEVFAPFKHLSSFKGKEERRGV